MVEPRWSLVDRWMETTLIITMLLDEVYYSSGQAVSVRDVL